MGCYIPCIKLRLDGLFHPCPAYNDTSPEFPFHPSDALMCTVEEITPLLPVRWRPRAFIAVYAHQSVTLRPPHHVHVFSSKHSGSSYRCCPFVFAGSADFVDAGYHLGLLMPLMRSRQNPQRQGGVQLPFRNSSRTIHSGAFSMLSQSRVLSPLLLRLIKTSSPCSFLTTYVLSVTLIACGSVSSPAAKEHRSSRQDGQCTVAIGLP